VARKVVCIQRGSVYMQNSTLLTLVILFSEEQGFEEADFTIIKDFLLVSKQPLSARDFQASAVRAAGDPAALYLLGRKARKLLEEGRRRSAK
jgi:hypothetical protein